MKAHSAPAAPALARGVVQPGAFFAQHEIQAAKVRRYASAMAAGAKFPPPVVARYGDKVMPLDGHHRLAAAAMLDLPLEVVECDGEALESLACDVGSAEADLITLAAANEFNPGQPAHLNEGKTK